MPRLTKRGCFLSVAGPRSLEVPEAATGDDIRFIRHRKSRVDGMKINMPPDVSVPHGPRHSGQRRCQEDSRQQTPLSVAELISSEIYAGNLLKFPVGPVKRGVAIRAP